MRTAVCACFIALFFSGLSTGYAQATSSPPERIDTFMRTQVSNAAVPGVALAVIQRGSVLLAKGYGESNVELQVPVHTETIFQSGSVGKQFAAALIMLLVEEGKIALEDSITKYFPEAESQWKAVTVRSLLTHTAGVPEYTTDSFDYQRDYSEAELTRMALALTPEFSPGARWSYSNTGYVLLGILIGRATGRFYGDLLRERIFIPAGMKTARIIDEAAIIPNRAAGYRMVEGTIRNQEWVAPQLNTTADGAIYLTLADFIAWDRAVRQRALLTAASWEQILTPVKLASGRSYPYGFGWFVDTANGEPLHQHSGQWQGFTAQISRYVGRDLSILVLANSADADVSRIAEGVAEIIDPTLAPPPLEAIKDREPRVKARARQLLGAARAGTLASDEFAYLTASQLDELASRLHQQLESLGEVRSITLMRRREVGDERIYLYETQFRNGVQMLRLQLTAADKVVGLALLPKP